MFCFGVVELSLVWNKRSESFKPEHRVLLYTHLRLLKSLPTLLPQQHPLSKASHSWTFLEATCSLIDSNSYPFHETANHLFTAFYLPGVHSWKRPEVGGGSLDRGQSGRTRGGQPASCRSPWLRPLFKPPPPPLPPPSFMFYAVVLSSDIPISGRFQLSGGSTLKDIRSISTMERSSCTACSKGTLYSCDTVYLWPCFE